MKIDESKCILCNQCIPYCPVEAIKEGEETCYIVEDECVECGICEKHAGCPVDAFYEGEMDELRKLRKAFSNPLVPHESTAVLGRGTEEMKTNEVTGRFKKGHVGIAVELGRPGIATRFYDVEKVTKKLASIGINKLEPCNPLKPLMKNEETGEIQEKYLNERVLSAIVEFDIDRERVPEALNAIKEVSKELETVFSLDLAGKLENDNTLPAAEIARDLGFDPSINGKTNLGLGRPKAKEGK
ncbi:4Fe-4S binding protein [Halanaerobium sp. MA284_MarDTE_T2]|uniref:indolepyruvate ferredoxin oxidoreductase subunit alpha n=1 Tax=Halanaerobium sp. MA284_MarDTE_T2 TaxID=2183913 RepID=UPI000DF26B4E|nr:4Fe-4S binding protein [Halanaerobium sp. MA284_MarDTE_T2]RCW48649.1 4Fe-4S binding protein [Halanaerobium sp. MA284_MarDTE_T2]